MLEFQNKQLANLAQTERKRANEIQKKLDKFSKSFDAFYSSLSRFDQAIAQISKGTAGSLRELIAQESHPNHALFASVEAVMSKTGEEDSDNNTLTTKVDAHFENIIKNFMGA